MRDERISLHLPESNTTCPFSSLSVGGKERRQVFGRRVSGGSLRISQVEARTLTGWRVNGSIGPVVLTWNLSKTMCRRRW